MKGRDHTHSGDDHTETDAPTRIVLVGRSDAERSLRKMRDVELIRAREPLQAIGEVANPIDPDSHAPTVVLVAPDAIAFERTAAFAIGIKRAAPDARILSLGEAAAPGFDGAITLDQITAGDLHVDLTCPPTAPGAKETSPEADHTPADLPDSSPQTDTGTHPIISAMLRGTDAIEAAMRGARERLGVPNAAFVAAARTSGPNPPPTGGIPVRLGDRLMGYLVAPRADRKAVEAEAAALAPWVALSVQHEQLKRAAFTDELTTAWNRRYFTGFLSAAIDKARSARHSVAVLYFDLDNFKVFNDRYGHAAGDEILIETVKLLRSVIRPTDRVCRIGGDEFAVIFYDPQGPRDPGRGQSPSEIGPIARRFQKQICGHKFPKLGGEAPGTLTISGGMAAFPWDGADVNTLLDRADQLALQSKRMGKDAITLGPGAERVCNMDPRDDR